MITPDVPWDQRVLDENMASIAERFCDEAGATPEHAETLAYAFMHGWSYGVSLMGGHPLGAYWYQKHANAVMTSLVAQIKKMPVGLNAKCPSCGATGIASAIEDGRCQLCRSDRHSP